MPEMSTNRLEAFSDGVIAIIITIMVLELRAPAQPTLWRALPAFSTVGLLLDLRLLLHLRPNPRNVLPAGKEAR